MNNKILAMGVVLSIVFSACLWVWLGGYWEIPPDITLSVGLNFLLSGQIMIPIAFFIFSYVVFYFLIPNILQYPVLIMMAFALNRIIRWYNDLVIDRVGKVKYDPNGKITFHNMMGALSLVISNHRMSVSEYHEFSTMYYRLLSIIIQFLFIYNVMLSGEFVFNGPLNKGIIYTCGVALFYQIFNGVVLMLWHRDNSELKRLFSIYEPDTDQRDISN